MRLTSNFRRKILYPDTEKLQALVRFKGTTESAAVREAIDRILAAEEIGAAIRELHALGGIDDVFHRMDDDEVEPSAFTRA